MSVQELLRQLKIYQELANSNEETFQRGKAREFLKELREILAPPQKEEATPTKGEPPRYGDVNTPEIKKKGRQPMKSTQLPKESNVSDSVKSWWNEQGLDIALLDNELPAFKDFHLSKGSVFKDWDAAFRTWMRNSLKFNKNKNDSVKSNWKTGTNFDDEFKKK